MTAVCASTKATNNETKEFQRNLLEIINQVSGRNVLCVTGDWSASRRHVRGKFGLENCDNGDPFIAFADVSRIVICHTHLHLKKNLLTWYPTTVTLHANSTTSWWVSVSPRPWSFARFKDGKQKRHGPYYLISSDPWYPESICTLTGDTHAKVNIGTTRTPASGNLQEAWYTNTVIETKAPRLKCSWPRAYRSNVAKPIGDGGGEVDQAFTNPKRSEDWTSDLLDGWW